MIESKSLRASLLLFVIFCMQMPLFAQEWHLNEVVQNRFETTFSDDRFGMPIAADGEYLLVGCPRKGNVWWKDQDTIDYAMVIIYKRDTLNSQWDEVQRLRPDSLYDDLNFRDFGWTLALKDSVLIIGDPNASYSANGINYRTGRVYVYKLQQTGLFSLTQEINIPEPRWNNTFGYSLAFDGVHLAIANVNDYLDTSKSDSTFFSGSVHLYKRNGGEQFHYIQSIYSEEKVWGQAFGEHMSLRDSWLFVGIPYINGTDSSSNVVDKAGIIQVYHFNASSNWTLTQKIRRSERELRSFYFGLGVQATEDYLFVGSYGQFYTPEINYYKLDSATWVHAGTLRDSLFQDENSVLFPYYNGTELMVIGHNISSYDSLTKRYYGGSLLFYEYKADQFELYQHIPGVRKKLHSFWQRKGVVFNENNLYFGCASAPFQGIESIVSAGVVFGFGKKECTDICDSISIKGCDFFTPSSMNDTLISSGRVMDTIAIGSCNLIWTIDVTMNYSSEYSVDTSSCGTLTLNYFAQDYTLGSSSAQFIIAGENRVGCDSIITVHYTSLSPNLDIFRSNDSLKAKADQDSYQWIDCLSNEYLEGETDSFLVVKKEGLYAVRISRGNCSLTSSCIFVNEDFLSATDSQNIRVFPNPAQSQFILSLQRAENLSSTLYSMEGKLLHQTSYTELKQVSFGQDLLPGSYILVIRLENGEKLIFRLVKIS